MVETAPTSSFACPTTHASKNVTMFTTDTSARVTKVMSCITRHPAKMLTNVEQATPVL